MVSRGAMTKEQAEVLAKKMGIPSEAIKDDGIVSGVIDKLTEAGKISPEIVGGITGGIYGQKIGSPFGVVGSLAGSVVGGIAGSVLGKTTQQELGLQPKESASSNIGEATKEEFIARVVTTGLGVAGKLAAPLIKPITKEAVSYAEKLGLLKPSEGKNIEDLFISSSTFNPMTKDPRNIIDAQNNVLNERILTVFEETGGQADAKRALKLANIVKNVRGVSDAESAFMINRDKINQKLQKALSVDNGAEKLQKLQANSVKQSFNQYFMAFNKKFDAIKSELDPLKAEAKIPVGNAIAEIEKRTLAVSNSLGREEGEKLLKIVTDSLRKGSDVSGQVPLTLQDLHDLDMKVKNVLPKFSPSKEVQAQIAGVYAGEIKPILSNLKTKALEDALKTGSTAENTKLIKALKLEEEFAKLAETKGALVNSKMAKVLGLTEQKQVAKATTPARMATAIFENPEVWEQTKSILKDVNPQLIPMLSDNYKARIVNSVFKEGSPQYTQIANLLSKQGEAIKDIAGADYLKTLQDVQMITKGLEATKDIASAKVALQPEDMLAGNTARYLLHPLAGTVGVMAGLFARGKQAVGLGKVSDEELLKVMTGKKGQKALEAMTKTFLDNPKSYNNYVQFVREVQKINPEVEAIDKESFNAQMGALISDLLNSQPAQQDNN
jgi:hypothetical protein